jgi:putative ABC transport system permease protein
MRLETLFHFYRQRLRTHPVQELLAGAGIAIGVALVFAVVVANTSISTSASQIVHGIAGNATLQLDARDEHGFSAGLVSVVRTLPSVTHAVGVLEERAMLTGPRGRGSVMLVGADASLAELGGPVTRDFISGHGLTLGNGLILPQLMARGLGVGSLPAGQSASHQRFVILRLRGRAQRVSVAAVFGSDVIGPLAGAMVVIGPLSYVQRLAALPGRVTRILVEPRPGQEGTARRELEAVAGGRITVASVESESRILAQASAPSDQSTGLFAAISAIVGLLLAFNAMLLTVPERRRSIAELRTHGYTPRQIVTMVVFDAVLLGIVASIVGVAVGVLLTRTVLDGVPTYLSFAFPLGVSHAVSASAVALSFAGGVAATFLAAAQPLLDLLPSRAADAVYREDGEPGQALGAGVRRAMGIAAVALLTATTVLVALVPSATVVGIAALALSTLLALPAVVALVVALAGRVARRRPRLNMLAVAVMALRATRLRAIVLAATGAVAVFGSVAIDGAHLDLVRGLHKNFTEYLGTADLWVTTGGDDLTTESFRPADAVARVRAVPGVAAVRPYFGSLLDIGERRVWAIARSSHDRRMIPVDQIKVGDATRATLALRHGGAAAVSEEIAAAQHTSVGGLLTLPTPTGSHRFRLVATLTNLGWGPGAVILNAADYRHAWRTNDPTALEVDLKPGVYPLAARAAVQAALGTRLALHVQTAADRTRQYDGLARDGLQRLTDISILLLVAAAIALAAATGAAIWQRRSSFADYRIQGFAPRQLWSALLIESGIVLVTGCAAGAVMGLYGHLLLGRWLELTTGFPAPFAPSLLAALGTLSLVAAAALVTIAMPSYRAVQVPPGTGLQH